MSIDPWIRLFEDSRVYTPLPLPEVALKRFFPELLQQLALVRIFFHYKINYM